MNPQNKNLSKNESLFATIFQTLSTLKKTLDFSSRFERKSVILLITAATVTAIIPYVKNGLFAKLIDETIGYNATKTGLETVYITLAFLIIATIVPSIVGLVYDFVDKTFRFNIVRHLDLHFFDKIASLDIATIESAEYQELAQKSTERGTMSVYNFLTSAIDSYSSVIGVVVSFVIISFIDVQLLAYAILGAVPTLYVQIKYGKSIFWIWDLNVNNRRTYFNRRSHFQGVSNLTELKLYQISKKFITEIKTILSRFDDELKEAEKSKFAWEICALVMFVLFLALGLWRIISLALVGTLPIGQMLFAYTTFIGFNHTLEYFFRRTADANQFADYARYWFLIDELKPKISSLPNATKVNFENNPPTIEFQHVSFKYSENLDYAIHNLSFVIQPGEKIAIVGLSGAGKTTLIKLLCRVYDPESGSIRINGVDLKDIDLESWHMQLGVLFQDYSTYDFTVKESIALGDIHKKLTLDSVQSAAKMAMADGFIERLPKKYDQLLWKGFEDGVDLSKGERQRMALARVLYRQSPITILDEPTASVDALAEQEIFRCLEELPDTRSVILISHRFSTVKNADTILVIEHGKLIEQGKHLKLMKQKGKYALLYTAQAESYNT